MWIDSLHNQVDDLQEDKLNNDTLFDSDTSLQHLLNSAIDTFQKEIIELDESEQEEWMNKLIAFLALHWAKLSENNVWELFSLLQDYSNVEKISLDNWLPFIDSVNTKSDLIKELWNSNFSSINELWNSKEAILRNLWYHIKHGNEIQSIIWAEAQEQIGNTDDFLQKVSNHTNLSLSEIKEYLVFWPTLKASIENNKTVSHYSDTKNKVKDLQQHSSHEEKQNVLKLWEFMTAEESEQVLLLSNNWVFAEWLREHWISDFISKVEAPFFSKSPEIIEKKAQVFDTISSKLVWDELNQILALYTVYLDYTNESSDDVDSYLEKLNNFEDMLISEFNSWASFTLIIERLYSIMLKAKDNTKVLKILGNLRKMKSHIQNNALESAIFASSFCPYAWDCVDIFYGWYKLKTWENLSWESVHKSDATTQLLFWCIGLWMNFTFPWLWTWFKAILKASPDLPIINSILLKIQSLFPALFKIFDTIDDSFASSFKKIKDYFVKNILPLISWEIKNLAEAIT